MSKFSVKYGNFLDNNSKYTAISEIDLQKFNYSTLNIGQLRNDGNKVESLTAIFDLEGFTNFCNQMEPHLVVPRFLHHFLEWIFKKIASEHIVDLPPRNGKQALYSPLPIYSKFLGDGVLMIWDTDKLQNIEIGNIVVSLKIVCESYATEFLPTISKKFVSVPKKLRCGISRGTVVSLGDGNDFVGPSINLASRLQKIAPNLTFAFSARGFDSDSFLDSQYKKYQTVSLNIRGINGNEEIAYVLKSEAKLLSDEETENIKLI
ncbi:hypothetical protein [Paenibacillus oryzisoli]|uniref:Guanylate cyclase domain-containing protein n=1 Tax=Paenibacillus oryzisoli TaxID=1850517 RepID=A0A197ZYU0_9BACL|nr:hypothetical protein [Paenibacillus oryzisoli]OAS13956.1 hypothetical protein A8708_11290 [Paenibacillus oryzisoli]